MSDTARGDGWWEASDQKWYPPEDHPDYVKPAAVLPQARIVKRPTTPEPAESSRSKSGFTWLSWQAALLLVAGVLSGLLLGFALGRGAGDDGETSVLGVSATTTPATSVTTASTTTTSTTTTTSLPPKPAGTLDDPLRLGETAAVGEWDVTVVGFTQNATDAAIAEGNEPPTDWHVYSLVTVRATYNGPDEGDGFLDLEAGLVGEDQLDYSSVDCAATPPEPRMSEQPSVSAGGIAEGAFCIQVPISQLESGTLYVEQTSDVEQTPAIDETRRWWATG